MESLTIGKVARAAGVGVETVRFYERDLFGSPKPVSEADPPVIVRSWKPWTGRTTMPVVELVHDTDCPNIGSTRANLSRALTEARLTPEWHEYRIGDRDLPAYAVGYGSPTILVDGADVVGVAPSGNSACCRLYSEVGGATVGAPPVSLIISALASHSRTSPPQRSGLRSSLAVVPGIGMALLPKIACLACWPAYAGFLSSLGLGFLTDTAWLLPLTAVFLVLAVAALAFRARHRRGYSPFALGFIASATVLLGKFAWESEPAMYAGIGLLVAASLWNSWPRSATQSDVRCQACDSLDAKTNSRRTTA